MYDELVSRLRNRRICIQQSGSLDDFPMLREAADAIEELIAESDIYRKEMTKEHNRAVRLLWEKEHEMPRWIPVSERLPETSGHYFICLECKCDGELFSAWMQVAWFCEKFYWEHLHSEDVFKETITHWMPLPDPPKEEN